MTEFEDLSPVVAYSLRRVAREWRLSLKILKKDLPHWEWHAIREGFGWSYVGYKGGQKVTLTCRAELCGPAEDDYRTSWFIQETGERYLPWFMRERKNKNG